MQIFANQEPSHLSLMQFRDDCRIMEAKLKHPSEEVKKKHPVFFYRLGLARLAQRFTRIGVETMGGGSTAFTERFEQVHASVLGWRESIPVSHHITCRRVIELLLTILRLAISLRATSSPKEKSTSASCLCI